MLPRQRPQGFRRTPGLPKSLKLLGRQTQQVSEPPVVRIIPTSGMEHRWYILRGALAIRPEKESAITVQRCCLWLLNGGRYTYTCSRTCWQPILKLRCPLKHQGEVAIWQGRGNNRMSKPDSSCQNRSVTETRSWPKIAQGLRSAAPVPRLHNSLRRPTKRPSEPNVSAQRAAPHMCTALRALRGCAALWKTVPRMRSMSCGPM